MEKNEILYGESGARRLNDIGMSLAGAYQEAFAGPPWYERSRCVTDGEFYELEPGCMCPDCGGALREGYDREQLVDGWQEMLGSEDGMMEVTLLGDTPVSATLARPTDASELYVRKYADNSAMELWLAENTPGAMVWIEDTFANRAVRKKGNLAGRARTLGAIAARYAGLSIMTRTKAPQIVAATLKAAPQTQLYVGSEQLQYNEGFVVPRAQDGVVPDARTLLRVEGV